MATVQSVVDLIRELNMSLEEHTNENYITPQPATLYTDQVTVAELLHSAGIVTGVMEIDQNEMPGVWSQSFLILSGGTIHVFRTSDPKEACINRFKLTATTQLNNISLLVFQISDQEVEKQWTIKASTVFAKDTWVDTVTDILSRFNSQRLRGRANNFNAYPSNQIKENYFSPKSIAHRPSFTPELTQKSMPTITRQASATRLSSLSSQQLKQQQQQQQQRQSQQSAHPPPPQRQSLRSIQSQLNLHKQKSWCSETPPSLTNNVFRSLSVDNFEKMQQPRRRSSAPSEPDFFDLNQLRAEAAAGSVPAPFGANVSRSTSPTPIEKSVILRFRPSFFKFKHRSQEKS
ncbi:hypothetical protein HK100_005594 [Physocladia obscura]|uniref:PH domain-containing protein n=1 Tax=Physocladia obscura TaxID=109957 RepID=A0AAD5TBL6_9FUNG|nr:hypothetical protein HK100_005594 [Physocladia obscura]